MIDFLVVVVTLGCFYALLATGLNLQLGTSGLANLGVAGFFAVGAYVTGMVMAPRDATDTDELLFKLGQPWIVAAVAAVVVTAVVGLLVGFVMSRVRLAPLFVAIITLAFAELLLLLLTTESSLANGFNGVRNVARPLSGVAGYFDYERYFAIVLLVLTALVVALVRYITHTPYGRTLRAVREDPELAESMGFDVRRLRLGVFVLGCAIMGLAGAFWAPYATVVEPSAFAIDATFLALVVVIIGGSGNALGPAAGSVLVICLIEEGSRFLPGGFATDVLPSARGIVIGLLLIVFLRLRPDGLVAERPQPHREVEA
ncbi:MAG TPA: branched-chain amino acid ABC transporter permease [Nocardioidaceae bacterium]|nr:branched-chain amino acid ABC transporter permease [Nocardioidaceae bacterium]